jgi:hypothetical protein
MIEERNVAVRDGRRLAVDVYALTRLADTEYSTRPMHNKDMLATEFTTTQNGHRTCCCQAQVNPLSAPGLKSAQERNHDDPI